MTYVLLVEDNQDNADFVIRILEPAGYEIRHVVRGLEATQVVRTQRPDLVLLDLNLPDIDGRNLILTLRHQLGRELAPPIVAVTARTGQTEEMLAARFGCTAFVRKPFDPREFLALVRSLAPIKTDAAPVAET